MHFGLGAECEHNTTSRAFVSIDYIFHIRVHLSQAMRRVQNTQAAGFDTV
jgi:hypothetical protein